MIITLDANILIRAVLGRRVQGILKSYPSVVFCIADAMVREARTHLPEILAKRRADPIPELAILDELLQIVVAVEYPQYRAHETDARQRLETRDPDDWPVAAVALAFNCPIWTEDSDFFGCGIPTWTTDRVELFLGSGASDQ